MPEPIALPPALTAAVGAETIDFAVRAGRSVPLRNALPIIGFTLFWNFICGIAAIGLLLPLLRGETVTVEVNHVERIVGPGNYGPAVLPILIVSVVVLIGLYLIGYCLYLLFSKGGYFVGTPVRLIHFKHGRIRSIDWEQFSGDIEVSGNAQNGHIKLGMRTGQVVRKRGYVPNTIYISGIPNAFEIEQMCRKRIKENDPTSPSS